MQKIQTVIDFFSSSFFLLLSLNGKPKPKSEQFSFAIDPCRDSSSPSTSAVRRAHRVQLTVYKSSISHLCSQSSACTSFSFSWHSACVFVVPWSVFIYSVTYFFFLMSNERGHAQGWTEIARATCRSTSITSIFIRRKETNLFPLTEIIIWTLIHAIMLMVYRKIF